MNTLLEIGLSNAVIASALALIAGAVGFYCRRPAVAHGLWLLVLLKLVTPPLVTLPIPGLAETETVARESASPPVSLAVQPIALPLEGPAEDATDAVGEVMVLADPELALHFNEDLPLTKDAREPATASPSSESVLSRIPWRTTLVTLWVGGSVSWLALALLRMVRFHRMLRLGRQAPARLQDQAERLARRLGLTQCPGIWLVPGRVSPMLWAPGGRPRLILPAGLVEHLNAELLGTLLVHELAHLRRRDHWVRALELLATALFWWHPVLWWARTELREAEEQCCDAWVVWALPEAGRAYATALVDTLDFLSGARATVPALASGLGHVNDLKRRLTMIMRGTTPRSLTWTGCLGLGVLAMLLLPVLPTWAQTEDIQKEVEKLLQQRRTRVVEVEKELQDRIVELKELHLQKGGDKEPGEQLERARREVKQMAENLERMRAQMKEAEAQLKAAMERLARMETRGPGPGAPPAAGPGRGPGGGTGGTSKTEEKIIIIIKDADGKVRTIEVPPADVKRKLEVTPSGDVLKRVEMEIKPFPATRAPVPAVPPTPATRTVPPGGAPGGGVPADARIRDLEKKIDALIKEMESLKRDLKDPRPKGGKPEEIEFEYKIVPFKSFERPVPKPNPEEANRLYYDRNVIK